MDIPVEKCEQVSFHVVASNEVAIGYYDVDDSHGEYGSFDDYINYIPIEESGILTLEVSHVGFGGKENHDRWHRLVPQGPVQPGVLFPQLADCLTTHNHPYRATRRGICFY